LLYQGWLLLFHSIPPSPPYFRAKVLRRLNRLGALALKNSVYILPDTAESTEDFQWLRNEIVEEGGEAWVFHATTAGGMNDDTIVRSFQDLVQPQFSQLLDEMKTGTPDWPKVKRRFEEIRRIDFFDAPGRQELEKLMQQADRAQGMLPPKSAIADLQNKTWVTRRSVKVDRISTAWLIRRYIDSEARILFVDPEHYRHAPGELRFDMFEGEFTHDGELCTFEVLLRRLKLRDPALEALAQIIHDIDLKEEKYGRPETAGFATMINGIAVLHADDERRLEEGARLLDATYAALKG
jgi:hypothetical protein